MKMRELKVGDRFQLVKSSKKITLLKFSMLGEMLGIMNCRNMESNSDCHVNPNAEVIKVESKEDYDKRNNKVLEDCRSYGSY